jgi:hypothetical protein
MNNLSKFILKNTIIGTFITCLLFYVFGKSHLIFDLTHIVGIIAITAVNTRFDYYKISIVNNTEDI